MAFYFPEPYKDEILYSVIARYHYYIGNKNTKCSLKELFGTETIIPTVELTSNLKNFCKLIGNRGIYNEEYFINKHTNLPFYLPFLQSGNQIDIKESMINSNGKGIYTKIGITAGGVCTKKGLYYCPQCVEEDIKNVGEPYFHRIHQVPGVMICPIHLCLVKQYVITRNDIGRVNYIRLNLEHVDSNVNYVENSIINDNLVKIAQCADYILNNNLSKFNRLPITEKYKNILEEKGLLTCKKRVKQKKLISLFKNYFTENLLEILQSNVDDKESNWVKMITRKPKCIIHPIRHILFILFLCDNFKTFFLENSKTSYPFDKPPWPCLNPVATHYKELVVNKCKITSDYKTRQPVATYECECGFIYSRKKSNEGTNDIYKIGRIKKYGEVWEKKLSQLIDGRQYSIRELGRIMKCDPKTIVKYARKLGKGNIIDSRMKIVKKRININGIKYREKYSSSILQLINEHPEYTRSQIRKVLKKEYAWFYRNDKQWLSNNLPDSRKKEHKNSIISLRVEWNRRDDETYMNIKNAYEDLINTEKLVRITKSIIGNKIGICALLYYHLDKLPRTKKYLSEITESIEDFQIRRINMICRSMIEKNVGLKKWSIMRKAGIKSNCSSRVMQKINDYLQLTPNNNAI